MSGIEQRTEAAERSAPTRADDTPLPAHVSPIVERKLPDGQTTAALRVVVELRAENEKLRVALAGLLHSADSAADSCNTGAMDSDIANARVALGRAS